MICNKADLPHIRQQHPGKVIVQTSGVFDLLHPGHIIYLEKCKKLGDILIVLIPSDEFIRQRKGINRPLQTQKDRATIVDALKVVDYVICTNKNYSTNSLPVGLFLAEQIGVNIIADVSTRYWEEHVRSLEKFGIELKILQHSGDVHTSDLINKARLSDDAKIHYCL